MNANGSALKRGILAVVLGAAGALGFSGTAFAEPSYGGDCAGCHQETLNGFEITGFQGMANPVGGVGDLKYFDALPGSTVGLSVTITAAGAPSNGVNIAYPLDLPGGVDVLPLTQGPGSETWTFAVQPRYYIGPFLEGGTHTFSLLVPQDAEPGFYPFAFTAAGSFNVRWAEVESFYVRVVPEAGTAAMLGAGLGLVGFVARRRQRAGPR